MERERELRMLLVEHLEQTRAIPSDALRNAFAAVPRHRYVPNVPLETAYDDRAVSIKELGGRVLSSISQPSMIARMLQLLDVRPGDSILEIGTGSGYNAALLAALAGPEGSVVTLEIEDDLIAAASAHLVDDGVKNVSVLHADAISSLEKPFDRIVVTARHNDIDPDWWRLLKDHGRIVVPLDLDFGGERAYGFVRNGERLVSVGSCACAFIGLRNDAPDARSEYFFRNQRSRYAEATSTMPLHVVAVQRENARPDLLSEADVVIARPATLFAFTS